MMQYARRSVENTPLRGSVIALVVVLLVSVAHAAGATTVASESKKGVAEAYAVFSTGPSATLSAVGGKRATSAMVSPLSAGRAVVTFTGKFPSDITVSKLAL